MRATARSGRRERPSRVDAPVRIEMALAERGHSAERGFIRGGVHVAGMAEDACDDCDEPVSDALARTVRLAVDRTQIDSQRLCPDCFAAWIDRYQEEMQPGADVEATVTDDDIIID